MEEETFPWQNDSHSFSIRSDKEEARYQDTDVLYLNAIVQNYLQIRLIFIRDYHIIIRNELYRVSQEFPAIYVIITRRYST